MVLVLNTSQFSELEHYDETSTSAEPSITELTCPNRQFKEKARLAKPKHHQGRHRTRNTKNASYCNWQSPFIWQQILQAQKAVGLKSPTVIVNWLKKRDPETFAKLNKSTVNGWIDKSGPTRCWTEQVMRWAESGSNPGHTNGGKHGVLVRLDDLVSCL